MYILNFKNNVAFYIGFIGTEVPKIYRQESRIRHKL